MLEHRECLTHAARGKDYRRHCHEAGNRRSHRPIPLRQQSQQTGRGRIARRLRWGSKVARSKALIGTYLHKGTGAFNRSDVPRFI